MLRVLMVDPGGSEGLEAALADRGVEVATVGSVAGAIRSVESDPVDVVVSELDLQDGDVLDLAATLRTEFDPGPPVVVYTDEGGELAASEAVGAGAVDYLPKSIDPGTATERVLAATPGTAVGPDYRRLFESAPVAIFVQDRDTIRYANRAAAEFFGEPAVEHLVGTDPMTYVPSAEAADARGRIRQVVKDREGFDAVEVRMRAADGTERTGLLAAAPIPVGSDPGIFVVVRDITERKRREETLEEFVEVVSHDLRNPLTVAQGHLELARERGAAEDFERAGVALGRIEAIVDGLLRLASERRRVDRPERVEIRDLADRAWAAVDTDGATLSLAQDLPVVSGDPGRLQYALENLFRNAAQHAGPDPTVRVGPLADGFYVADDGPGMADVGADRLSVSHALGSQATGFGLGIVGRIVEAHGWQPELTESDAGGVRLEVTGVDTVESTERTD